jgi:hypothetical protein
MISSILFYFIHFFDEKAPVPVGFEDQGQKGMGRAGRQTDIFKWPRKDALTLKQTKGRMKG